LAASLDDIITKLDVRDIFAQCGAAVVREKGDWLEGSCPFCHDPKHFSFNQQGGWICHKCGEKGNLITLLSRTRNCTTKDAFKQLLKLAGVENEGKQPTPKKPRAATPLPVPGAAATAIYERLIDLTDLGDTDRQALKAKRGFTDETIDTFRLRTGGKHLDEIVQQIRAEFPESDLLESGILVEVNGVRVTNSQLLEDRILIPYLDENGKVYYLRPHKLGFKDIGIQPFCRFLLKDNPEHIVLTEGEFKAVALWQWGVPALAIPGISSFGLKNLDRLTDMLKRYGVKHVTIIFDNEIKDDPTYPNFKPRIEDRYDTQVWSCIMARKLLQAGFVAHVGWLPDTWRQGAKIDWDGALAAGHTREEVLRVINKAVPVSEFIAGLPEEAQFIVKKKVNRHFVRLSIRRDFNRYVAIRARGEETYEEPISNFVINIKANYFTPSGVVRMVQFVNEYGERSDTFALEPDSMAGLNEFKKFCLSKGNYLFKGKTADLTNMWEYEFLNESGEFIFMPDRIGRLDNGVWLFGNMAIWQGQIYRPDNDGIIWISGRGYKPQSLQMGPSGEAIEDAIPALFESNVNIQMIAKNLKQAVGGYEAYVGIGWVIAAVFSDDIFTAYKCVPILFPHGKRESGKSTFMRWLMNFFGIETEGYGLAETTQNFIARALSYYSNLGCWFDEYRNEPKVTVKDGYLRSAYNRQLSGKGTATSFQARGFSVRSALAVSGEEMPRDNGLYTRLVPIQMSANRRDRSMFEWVNKNCTKFSGFVRELIMNYDTYKPRILSAIADLKKALIARDVPDRIAENWAICAASFYEIVDQDDDFIRWVEQNCQEMKFTRESEHMLNVFWDDINTLISMGELNTRYLKVSDDGKVLHIWFPGVYNIWSTFFRRKTGREPFDKASILKYMQDEPYCGKQANTRFGSAVHKAYPLDLAKAPDVVVEIADAIAEMQGLPAFGDNEGPRREELF
jgi:DNA primase